MKKIIFALVVCAITSLGILSIYEGRKRTARIGEWQQKFDSLSLAFHDEDDRFMLFYRLAQYDYSRYNDSAKASLKRLKAISVQIDTLTDQWEILTK